MEFGRLRGFFWPIHRHELRVYLPLFLLTFLLGIDYHILRNLKYGLLVLAKDAGAEAIPFVQLWGLAPGAFVMAWLLVRLCRRLSQAQIFYFTVSGFLVFFALFQFGLYPYREQLEPTRLVNWLSLHLPSQLSGFVAIIRHWSISLFYVLAELWKVSVLAVLFWGFVNTHVPLSQASRFYGPLMVGSSLAGLVGGKVTSWFPTADWVQRIGIGETPWHRALSAMMLLVIAIGFVILLVFRYLEKQSAQLVEARQEKSGKAVYSIRESIKTFLKSRYLISLGLIVTAEYVTFGLGEILWKDRLKDCFPDPRQFTAYTGEVIFWASILSITTSALFSGGLLNRLGWVWSAIVAPVVQLTTTTAFYIFVLFPQAGWVSKAAALFGVTPLVASVFLGGVHNCLCRVVKSSLTDPSKELAFVPLNRTQQLQGKTVIDGIGMHAGRGGGALVQQILLVVFPTVVAGAGVSFVVILAGCALWIHSVLYVGRQFSRVRAASVAAS